MSKTILYNIKIKKQQRRDLRQRRIMCERIMWRYLRDRRLDELKFRRQFSVGLYIIDFYCPKIKLAVEIDGATHNTSEEIASDSRRQKYLESLGITIKRYTNGNIKNNISWVLDDLRLICYKSKEQPTSSRPLLAKEMGNKAKEKTDLIPPSPCEGEGVSPRPLLAQERANKSGFALIEIIVAIALFSSTMLIVMGIFKSVIEGQRGAIAAQNTQESMRFAFEIMSKEIRMAKKSDNSCAVTLGLTADSPVKKIFNTANSGQILYFKNKDDLCVSYSLELNVSVRLKIVRGSDFGYITPDEINVSNLNFIVVDNTTVVKDKQAKVTMKMDVEAKTNAMNKNKMTMQTTLSSRNYAN